MNNNETKLKALQKYKTYNTGTKSKQCRKIKLPIKDFREVMFVFLCSNRLVLNYAVLIESSLG